MALSKKTATKHNLNRADVFAAAGVNDWDVKYAHPKFLGKTTEDADCSLCGKQHLMWLYELRFDAPDLTVAIAAIEKGISRSKEVVFNPVGSVCINDWFDALPESEEKLAALKRWKAEMDKERAAKTHQGLVNALAKAGLASVESVLERIKAISFASRALLPWKERKLLSNYSYTLSREPLSFAKRWGSVKAIKAFGEALVKAEGIEAVAQSKAAEIAAEVAAAEAFEAAKPAPAPAAPAPLAPTIAAKLETGRDVFRDKAKLAQLKDHEQAALADMGKKVKAAGRFFSSRQESYFDALVKKANKPPVALKVETPVTEEPITEEPSTTTGPESGSAEFVSASGIVGARY